MVILVTARVIPWRKWSGEKLVAVAEMVRELKR